MGVQVVFKKREIRHRSIDHTRERHAVTIFRNDDVTAPCVFLLESVSLNVTDSLVDWERHIVPGDSRIENYIWIGKLPVHAVERFDKLCIEARFVRTPNRCCRKSGQT